MFFKIVALKSWRWIQLAVEKWQVNSMGMRVDILLK